MEKGYLGINIYLEQKKYCHHMKKILLTLFIFSSAITRSQIISTVAGNGILGFSGDGGLAVMARLNNPQDVAIDLLGNLYIADTYNNLVRKVDSLGVITTIAGNGASAFGGDGGPALIAGLSAEGLDFDTSGNLYIADILNHRIRKINSSGIITTIAGNGTPGYSGDGTSAVSAKLNYPSAVACDRYGNIYIADTYNNRVRKVNPSGIITTVAGNGSTGYSGDGIPATSASVFLPRGVAVDKTGNLYISEYGNSRIRKVSASGIISTFAGVSTTGFGGDGGPATDAQLQNPMHIRFDTSGNLFIADYGNSIIRIVDPSGIINRFAGNTSFSYYGDGGSAILAGLNQPAGVAIGYNCAKNVFIADGLNSRIRMVTENHSPVFIRGDSQNIAYCYTSAPYNIDTLLSISDLDTGQPLVWSVLIPPYHGAVVASYSATSTGGIITPAGLSYTPVTGFIGTDSFRVRVTDCNHAAAAYTTVYVSIDSLPDAGSITGPEPDLCVGDSITLIDSAAGGVWSASNSNATVAGGIVTGLAAGYDTIAYTVINACGIASTSQFVTIFPLPAPISGTSDICMPDVAAFTDPTSGGTWESSDPAIANINSVTGDAVGVSPGSFTITYTLSTGCFVTKMVTINTPPCVNEVQQTSIDEMPVITPNPATDEITIQMSKNAYKECAIINYIGQVLITQKLSAEQTKINITTLPPGIYYTRLSGDSYTQMLRFVKL